MRKIIILLCLLLLIPAFSVKYVALPCTADTYSSLLSPSANYGTSTTLDSQVKFAWNGQFSNIELKTSYFNYTIPPNLLNKVKVLNVFVWFYVNINKGYAPSYAVYYAGLYPCLGTWGETTLNWDNQPSASGPGYYSVDSLQFTIKTGWNKFALDKPLVQKMFDTGSPYGMACYVEVTGEPDQPLPYGNYMSYLQIASRESGHGSYLGIEYEPKTGMMVNGCNVEASSLGNVKALYQ